MGYLAESHSDALMADKLEKELALKKKEESSSIKEKEVIVSKDYPFIKYDGNAEWLPTQATRLYGCHNCEWKSTVLCPFGFKKGKGQKHNYHNNGLCEMRRNYLLSFYRGEAKRPKFTEWQLDYNQGVAQLQLHEDFKKIKFIEKKLSELEKNPSKEEERNDMRRVMLDYRENWFKLWKALVEEDDRRIDRDKPKKIMVGQVYMTLTDIHRIMSQEKAGKP